MKLQAGTKKIICADDEAAAENAERYRNRGRIFVPPFRVFVLNPEGSRAVEHRCFSFKARNLIARTTAIETPHPWAPREVRDSVRNWFETEGEVDLTITQPEDL